MTTKKKMLPTYTNLRFPRGENDIPLNAYDSRCLGRCRIIWFLQRGGTAAVDPLRFQMALSNAVELVIHGGGNRSNSECINDILREVLEPTIPHLIGHFYCVLIKSIPRVICYSGRGGGVRNVAAWRRQEKGLFFTSSSIFKPYDVLHTP